MIILYFSLLFIDGFQRIIYGSQSFFINVAYGVLVVGILYNYFQNGKIFLSKPVFYFLLFCLGVYASLFVNDFKENQANPSFHNWISAISILMWPSLFLYFSQLRLRSGEVKKIFGWLRVIGIIMAINCIAPLVLYFVSGIRIGELSIVGSKIRFFGFLTDQIGFGLIYFLIYYVYKNKIAFIVFFSVAILITGTRGAIIAGGFAFLIALYYRNRDNSIPLSGRNITFFIGIILAFLILNFGPLNIFDAINFRFDAKSIENTSVQRFNGMNAGISLFLNNPLFGVGYGNFASSVLHDPKLFGLFNYNRTMANSLANAQNQFIDIAANGGLVCLFAMFAFLFHNIKRIKYRISNNIMKDEFRVILIFLISMLLFNQTALYLINYGIISLLLMILLGISCARIYIAAPNVDILANESGTGKPEFKTGISV